MALYFLRAGRKLRSRSPLPLSLLYLHSHPPSPNLLAPPRSRPQTLGSPLSPWRHPCIGSWRRSRILDGFRHGLSLASMSSSPGTTEDQESRRPDGGEGSPPASSSRSWVDLYLPESVRPYALLARLDKPIGTWLLFWPCMWY